MLIKLWPLYLWLSGMLGMIGCIWNSNRLLWCKPHARPKYKRWLRIYAVILTLSLGIFIACAFVLFNQY